MQKLGKRIWQLMPDRDRVNAIAQAPEPHDWNEDVERPLKPNRLAASSARFKLKNDAIQTLARFCRCISSRA